MRNLHRILCPIDFSEFSRRAYGYAHSLASRYGATLFAQYVVELWKYRYAEFAASFADYENSAGKCMREARSSCNNL